MKSLEEQLSEINQTTEEPPSLTRKLRRKRRALANQEANMLKFLLGDETAADAYAHFNDPNPFSNWYTAKAYLNGIAAATTLATLINGGLALLHADAADYASYNMFFIGPASLALGYYAFRGCRTRDQRLFNSVVQKKYYKKKQ